MSCRVLINVYVCYVKIQLVSRVATGRLVGAAPSTSLVICARLPRSIMTHCGPSMGLPVMSLAACQRSRSQSVFLSSVICTRKPQHQRQCNTRSRRK